MSVRATTTPSTTRPRSTPRGAGDDRAPQRVRHFKLAAVTRALPTHSRHLFARDRRSDGGGPMTQAQLDRWIEELYPQWVRYLRGNWRSIRQSRHEEDVAQTVVQTLHECRAWERFEGDPDNRSHVAGWLLGYVKKVAANWQRYQRRRQAWPLFDTDMRVDPSAESGVPMPAELKR